MFYERLVGVLTEANKKLATVTDVESIATSPATVTDVESIATSPAGSIDHNSRSAFWMLENVLLNPFRRREPYRRVPLGRVRLDERAPVKRGSIRRRSV